MDTPTPSATPTPLPTPTPTEVALTTPTRRTLSVGLVGSDDAEWRVLSAREGLQRAAREQDVEVFDLPSQPGDLARNASRLAESGYDLVIVASAHPEMGLWLAKRFPLTRFAVFGAIPDPAPANLVGLVFAEDQAGFLAGALAGWLTERDMVAFVGAGPTVEIVKYRKGYEHGVQYVNTKAVVLGKYLDSFTAPEKGAAEAAAQLDEGADVLFAAGGATALGALETAAERGVAVIASEVDPYQSRPAVASRLVAAALVRADVAVQEVIKATKQGAFKPGTLTFDAKNGGIALGPYHGAGTALPDEAKAQLRRIFDGLREGTIKTNVEIPEY